MDSWREGRERERERVLETKIETEGFVDVYWGFGIFVSIFTGVCFELF
jgi:hypothetical protein